MASGRSRSSGQERIDFIAYLRRLAEGEDARRLDPETRGRLRALLEEGDRFRQWEGVVDFLFRLDRDGLFRFLGSENGERGTCYRFLDTTSRSAVVVPAPPVAVRTIEPDRARGRLVYPCPIPTSAEALAESLRRLCHREALERRLADLVILRLEGEEVHLVGRPAELAYTGSPRFMPEYVDEHVVRLGQSLLVSDLRGDPALETHPACGSFGAVGVFPLRPETGQPSLGLMEAWRVRAGEMAPETADFLAAFASFLAGLIVNVRHLEGLIFMDAVTEVYNRRSFDEVLLDREVARADRGESRVALLLADVDDFKVINDTCGHPVGDRVLWEVGRLLRDRLRPLVDFVARVGGDEFAVILPGVSSVDATRRVAERLLNTVADFDFSGPSRAISGPVSLSVGGAVYNGKRRAQARARKDARGQLVERADQALYRAKEKGKGRVFVWDEEVS